jgi:hypothetical protein
LTSIYGGRSGVQILAETRDLSLLQNIQTSSNTNPASNSRCFSENKLANADSLTTHINIEPSLKISEAIPPLNLSTTIAHIGTTIFYFKLLPKYISANGTHLFLSYKGTIYTLLTHSLLIT